MQILEKKNTKKNFSQKSSANIGVFDQITKK